MKLLFTVVGAILVLVGAVWIGQGFNLIPGSFMTGHMEWAAYGAVAALGGLALIVLSRRRR
ncbi:MAG: hypothetical protein JSR45_11520 [Proteobacteria bacterium]|nr:hypothetical protein [Pseudomonadota bacterium]